MPKIWQSNAQCPQVWPISLKQQLPSMGVALARSVNKAKLSRIYHTITFFGSFKIQNRVQRVTCHIYILRHLYRNKERNLQQWKYPLITSWQCRSSAFSVISYVNYWRTNVINGLNQKQCTTEHSPKWMANFRIPAFLSSEKFINE